MKTKLKITFSVFGVFLIVLILASLVTAGMILFRSLGTEHYFTYMIVLGTDVEGSKPSAMLQDRIQAAAAYMEAHPHVICVVSGGKAKTAEISEAQCMYNGLTALGIAPDRILMEDKATSTAQNIAYSMKILEERLGRKPAGIGILSSEFHLLRAGIIGKSYDLPVATIPANTSDANSFFRFFLREIPLVWWDSLKAAFR